MEKLGQRAQAAINGLLPIKTIGDERPKPSQNGRNGIRPMAEVMSS
jgi:hypothetical protein